MMEDFTVLKVFAGNFFVKELTHWSKKMPRIGSRGGLNVLLANLVNE